VPRGPRPARPDTRWTGLALNEIATASGVGIELREETIPIPGPVRAACEMLGLDPLHVANEGKLVAIVPAESAAAVVAAMRAVESGVAAVEIGRVVADHAGNGHDEDHRRLATHRRHDGRGAAAPDLLKPKGDVYGSLRGFERVDAHTSANCGSAGRLIYVHAPAQGDEQWTRWLGTAGLIGHYLPGG